jgi:hypothetical protein
LNEGAFINSLKKLRRSDFNLLNNINKLLVDVY